MEQFKVDIKQIEEFRRLNGDRVYEFSEKEKRPIRFSRHRFGALRPDKGFLNPLKHS